MEMNFCRRCGGTLHQENEGLWQCDNAHSTYLNAAPTAGVFFITDDNQVILSRRAIEPGKGMLDSFGGFVDSGESAEEAIIREIREEMNLSPHDYEPLRIFCTAPSRYRYENEERPVLSTFFWSRLLPSARPTARDDVAEIVTLLLEGFDFDLLHSEDAKIGLRELQNLRRDS